MGKCEISEKKFWESKGWKLYGSAWEAVGMSPEEAELAEAKFQMSRKAKYDGQYLDGLIEKATKNWADVEDKDLWLREIRGSYDAQE